MSAAALALHEATDDRALDAAMSRALRTLVGGRVAWSVLLCDADRLGAVCWRGPVGDGEALDPAGTVVASVLAGAPGWVATEPVATYLGDDEVDVFAALPLDYRQQAFGALLIHSPVRLRDQHALEALVAAFARALANQQRFGGARDAYEAVRARLDGVMRATGLLALREPEALLLQLLALSLEVTGAEVGCLLREDGECFEWGMSCEEARALHYDGAAVAVAARQRPVAGTLSGERHFAAVAVTGTEGQVGALVIGSSRSLAAQLPVLGAVASVASMALSALQAQQARQARVRAETVLRLAAEHQRALLGEVQTDLPGAAVVARTVPCEETGGDLYACIPLPDGRVAVAVGDVVGHGVAATLHLSSALGALRALLPVVPDPAEVLRHMDGPVATSMGEDRFMTLFLAIFDPGDGLLRYASAGHDPAWWLPLRGEVRELPATCVPLGGLGIGGWSEGVLRLSVGDRLVIASDGLVEATGPGGPYSRERLAHHLAETSAMALDDALESVFCAVHGFCAGHPPADDWTLVMLQRRQA